MKGIIIIIAIIAINVAILTGIIIAGVKLIKGRTKEIHRQREQKNNMELYLKQIAVNQNKNK